MSENDANQTVLSEDHDELPRLVLSPLQFDIFTLFPKMFTGVFSESILKRAQEKGLVRICVHDIRAYTTDKHHVCDGTPYGGGGGMVMKPEPIFRAVETVLSRPPGWELPPEDAYTNLPPWDPERPTPLLEDAPIILLTPQGRRFDQNLAQALSQKRRIALICGRYEGVDERVRTQLATDELSIGDYVLSGGELPAMVVVDAVTRLVPGALGYAGSAHWDSHSPGADGLLEGPHYTRPFTFRGESVPEVLISGHHAMVERWRREQSLLRTLQRRPDLLEALAERGGLSVEDRAFLRAHGWPERKES